MAGCDGWITIKVLLLLLAVFCVIFKRVTDDEANKLFFFLQKYSREWPLLKNITWEENGAIFTDVTYGGFVIILIGLIIGQATGELQHHRKTENFFLIAGALMFIGAGSLELAALDAVEDRLVDNAAILGVVSLVTGFLFILDLLLGSKRRKKSRLATIRKKTQPKTTQTEDTKIMEAYRSSDMNGNIQNGGYFQEMFPRMGSKKIPRNGVKILPSSPILDASAERLDVAPPMYTPNELKTAEGKIRSTESFLRSEKGEYLQRSKAEPSTDQILIPPGYMLVPIKPDGEKRESITPPGYATVIADSKHRTPPGYVMIPIDQIAPKNKDGTRKLQSPTVTTTFNSPQGYYPEDSYSGRTPQPSLNLSMSDLSDVDDNKQKKPVLKKSERYSPEYPGNSAKLINDGYQRADSRMSHNSLQDFRYLPRGRLNQGFDSDFDGHTFKRNGSYHSDKPKSILRFDRIRSSTRKADEKEERYDSLDSRKIAEDLRHLKEITRSDLDLAQDLEDENEMLKRRLRREKQESEKLIQGLKKQLDEESKSYSQRKKSEERINELEDMGRLLILEKKVRDLEEKKLREDEKDRRMSEREEHYFGLIDLKQSQRESSPIHRRKASDIEQDMRKQDEGGGAKKTNETLKEKVFEQEDKAREDIKVIEDGFYFLDEEEKRKKNLRRGKSPAGVSSTKTPSPDDSGSQMTDEEIRLRIETPGSSSYKSEAQVWLGSDGDLQSKEATSVPTSPISPGYVLHTAQNWPETPSPSPQDRFRFSSKRAQNLKIESVSKTPSPETGPEDDDEDRKSQGRTTRRVDFTEVPLKEVPRPATVIGSTSSWKKWLQPKPKFHHTKSAPT